MSKFELTIQPTKQKNGERTNCVFNMEPLAGFAALDFARLSTEVEQLDPEFVVGASETIWQINLPIAEDLARNSKLFATDWNATIYVDEQIINEFVNHKADIKKNEKDGGINVVFIRPYFDSSRFLVAWEYENFPF